MDYKKYELKKKRGIGRVNLDKNKALTGIQMKDKATTTTNNLLSRVLLIYMPSPTSGLEASRHYNHYSISNTKIWDWKSLFRKHDGMRVMLQVFATLKSKNTNEDVRQVIISNEGEIPNVLNQMASDVEHQAEVMEVSENGLVITHIDKLKFNYDKYNPPRGGKFMPLPNWVSSKKRVSKSKIKMNYVSSIPFNAVYVRFMRKTTPKECLTTKSQWWIELGQCQFSVIRCWYRYIWRKQRRESSSQCLFYWPWRWETIHFTLQTDQGSKGNSSNQSSKTGGWIWLPLCIHQRLWQVDRMSNQQTQCKTLSLCSLPTRLAITGTFGLTQWKEMYDSWRTTDRNAKWRWHYGLQKSLQEVESTLVIYADFECLTTRTGQDGDSFK